MPSTSGRAAAYRGEVARVLGELAGSLHPSLRRLAAGERAA
jgi:hypothetical protein